MSFWSGLRDKARAIKRDIHALGLCYRHPQMPWLAKLWVLMVVAYAISPIDLIPDFIPVLGYLDDVILLPLGIVIAIKLVPPAVLADCRAQVAAAEEKRLARGKAAWLMATIVVLIWTMLAVGCTLLAWRWYA